jgi:CheY-like chemotaxis protein
MAGRILVVDDDEVIRQLIRVNLELEGFQVHTAVDGQDCLDRVDEVAPQLVTLDAMMPRLDGFRTAEQLRGNPQTSHIRIVMLSARAQDQDRRQGEAAGADAYLTKPFDPDDLIRLVQRLLAQG